MNGDIIELSPPVRLTSAVAQELRLALDVQDYDHIDLELSVLQLEGTGTDITVQIQTGMQIHTTTGWVLAGQFPTVSTSNVADVLRISGCLRYIRWRVSSLNGTATAATFSLRGVGRRASRTASADYDMPCLLGPVQYPDGLPDALTDPSALPGIVVRHL